MNFSDLKVYNIGLRLVKEIQTLVDSGSKLRYLKETQQLIRSAASVPANIAEGFAKKVYPKDFIRFLNIALGSSDETQCHIAVLYINNNISQKDYEYFLNQYKNLSIKILNLIKAIRKDKNIPF